MAGQKLPLPRPRVRNSEGEVELETYRLLQRDDAIRSLSASSAFRLQQKFRFSMAKCRVLVCEHQERTISLWYGPHLLGRYDRDGQLLQRQEKTAA
jgi:hypothetical protein